MDIEHRWVVIFFQQGVGIFVLADGGIIKGQQNRFFGQLGTQTQVVIELVNGDWGRP